MYLTRRQAIGRGLMGAGVVVLPVAQLVRSAAQPDNVTSPPVERFVQQLPIPETITPSGSDGTFAGIVTGAVQQTSSLG